MSASPNRLQLYLCHADVDKPKVRQLYQQLENDGMQPWFDEEDLDIGGDREQIVAAAIKESHAIVVCLSKQALNTAGFIHRELKWALEKAELQPEGAVTIIPVRLDDCAIPHKLEGLVSVDLFGEGGGYGRLIKSLTKMAERRKLETTSPTRSSTSPANFTLSSATAPASPASDSPKVLSFAERSGIIERLMACHSLSNPGSRETVIQNLPAQIASSVARASQTSVDVSNLLTTCLNYPQGLQKLLEVVSFFEQGSIPFRELESYVKQIL